MYHYYCFIVWDCKFYFYFFYCLATNLKIVAGENAIIVSDSFVIIKNKNEPVNITCAAIPQGPYPLLTLTNFNNNSVSFPVYANTNGVVAAAFEGGFSSELSGLYKCTSADGYSKESYIVLSEGE